MPLIRWINKSAVADKSEIASLKFSPLRRFSSRRSSRDNLYFKRLERARGTTNMRRFPNEEAIHKLMQVSFFLNSSANIPRQTRCAARSTRVSPTRNRSRANLWNYAKIVHHLECRFGAESPMNEWMKRFLFATANLTFSECRKRSQMKF